MSRTSRFTILRSGNIERTVAHAATALRHLSRVRDLASYQVRYWQDGLPRTVTGEGFQALYGAPEVTRQRPEGVEMLTAILLNADLLREMILHLPPARWPELLAELLAPRDCLMCPARAPFVTVQVTDTESRVFGLCVAHVQHDPLELAAQFARMHPGRAH